MSFNFAIQQSHSPSICDVAYIRNIPSSSPKIYELQYNVVFFLSSPLELCEMHSENWLFDAQEPYYIICKKIRFFFLWRIAILSRIESLHSIYIMSAKSTFGRLLPYTLKAAHYVVGECAFCNRYTLCYFHVKIIAIPFFSAFSYLVKPLWGRVRRNEWLVAIFINLLVAYKSPFQLHFYYHLLLLLLLMSSLMSLFFRYICFISFSWVHFFGFNSKWRSGCAVPHLRKMRHATVLFVRVTNTEVNAKNSAKRKPTFSKGAHTQIHQKS